MKLYLLPWLCATLFITVLSLNTLAAEDPADVTLRMANGAVIEGTMQEATPDGLVIQGEKGKYIAPWKYLSAGTRYRYVAALEIARSNALQKAATAAKVAATNATGTNAVGVVSNTPAKK